MDGENVTVIHEALVSVQDAVDTLTFPSCDKEDVHELIDRIEFELHALRSRRPSRRRDCPAPGGRESE